jgi:hypothetical protein
LERWTGDDEDDESVVETRNHDLVAVVDAVGHLDSSSSLSAPLLNMKKIFHFPLLCYVFMEAVISMKQIQLLHENGDAGDGMITKNYQNKLNMIAENTIMIIYSLILSEQVTISLDSSGSSSSSEEIAVKSVLQAAEMLPNSSFCRIVIRWIYEELTR